MHNDIEYRVCAKTNCLCCILPWHVFSATVAFTRQLVLQVAVKKLPTARVPPQPFAAFMQQLQTLAFATKTCSKLCRLMGLVILDGNICQVLQLYQQSLQDLLAAGAPRVR